MGAGGRARGARRDGAEGRKGAGRGVATRWWAGRGGGPKNRNLRFEAGLSDAWDAGLNGGGEDARRRGRGGRPGGGKGGTGEEGGEAGEGRGGCVTGRGEDEQNIHLPIDASSC